MLSLIEQEVLLEMFYQEFKNMKFSSNTQTILKYNDFYRIIGEMILKGYINTPHRNPKNKQKTYYTLTDRGRLFANQIAKDFNTNKKYWFLGSEIVWDYAE